jgi:tocopherol O-methyltransferase
MVDGVLAWAGVTHATRVLDVGCGLGGSSRHLARKFGASARGVTLSPVQVERATALTSASGLSNVSFQVADALALPFPDGSFDLVWSLESGEHMPDKRRFLAEMARVCAPGGRIILVTWCKREGALSEGEERLLRRICRAYFLPPWVPMADYMRLAQELGLAEAKRADWSLEVAPFWRAVIDTVFSWRGFTGLLRSGLGTIKGALVMPLMQAGLRSNLIKFELACWRKPT